MEEDVEKLAKEFYQEYYTIIPDNGVIPRRNFAPNNVVELDAIVKVIKDDSAADLPLPEKATEGSSGYDLRANIEKPILLNAIGSSAIIPTGIRIQLPRRFEAQIRPRSGLAAKHGITVLNTPGTIDSDYTGEIKIILINLSTNRFKVERGMRIAQMVICGPLPEVALAPVDEFEETERGSGGFGSTGI